MSFQCDSDNATAFEVSDAPQSMAVVENMQSPYDNDNAMFFKRNVPSIKRSKQLNLAAWNVRTTNDSDSTIRPERATAIICKELEKAGIDICALSEVRRPGTGNVKERSHTIFWSGGKDRTAGVGFAISNKFGDINPVPVNERLVTARLPLNSDAHLTIISVYAPTMQRSPAEKKSFYEKLGECIVKAKGDNIIVLGDFNARVGKDWQSWPTIIGKHGVGKMNSNGLMLLEFCTRFQLSIMGTMFQLKNHLKNTWQHMRSKHWHQIDHVLADKQAAKFINVTKVNPRANCFTDHKLLICRCSIVVRKKRTRAKPPTKLDTTMNAEKKERLVRFLDERLQDIREESWEDLRKVLQNATNYTFDKKKRRSQDWFEDHDETIQSLLKDKKLNGDRSALREEIRKLKNKWFQQKAEEAERFAKEKNLREFYATINAVYGPKPRNLHSVRAKNGVLLSSPEDIKERWVEHFEELLNQPTDVDWSILDELEQRPIIKELDEPIKLEEVTVAIKNTKLKKSPGQDGILPEVLVYGGPIVISFLLAIFNLFWISAKLPSDLIDAIICIIFKKGDRTDCGNYRGISLLSVVGKIFADIVLQRLKRLAELVYPESQSGYRDGRGTVDGIFILRQMMEKCREQRQNLHIAFIDFTKAFDCINRELLFKILGKLGCPANFVQVIRTLYSEVHARLCIDGKLSNPIEYNSGVKQGCKLAPTLFGMYAAVMLYLAFKDISPGYSIKVRFRYDGDLFDLRRLKSKTKTFSKYIREAQYADDIAIFTNDGTALQCLLSAYSKLSLKMGLRINIKKTETMSVGEQLDFYIDGHKLKRVDRFKYLGSYVTKNCKLDEEVTARIQAASCAMGRLRNRVFDCRDLTVETKLKVYNQCIIPLMTYGSETWTLYCHHIKLLRTIQQRHLRSILKIRWDHFVTNDEVLDRAKSTDIEIILVRNRLRWIGHVARMPDERPVKALLYGVLEEGSRRVGRPLLRYKDTLKDILKRGAALGTWREIVTDRIAWRRLVSDICDKIEIDRRNKNIERRAKRHHRERTRE